MAAGFGGPILHGLATFGFVARGILAAAGGNDPTALKAFGARFTSPVKLGGTFSLYISPGTILSRVQINWRHLYGKLAMALIPAPQR
jgi:acyl dehydratase